MQKLPNSYWNLLAIKAILRVHEVSILRRLPVSPIASLTDANSWMPHKAALQLPIGSSVELDKKDSEECSVGFKFISETCNGKRMIGHGCFAGTIGCVGAQPWSLLVA